MSALESTASSGSAAVDAVAYARFRSGCQLGESDPGTRHPLLFFRASGRACGPDSGQPGPQAGAHSARPKGAAARRGSAVSAGRIPPEDPADRTRSLPGPAPPLGRLRGAGRVGTARAPAVRVAVTRAAFCVYTQNAAAKRRLGSSGARPPAPAPGLAGSRRQVRAEARCSPPPCANQAQPEALASGFFPRKRGKKFFARAARRADKEVRDPARRFA